MSESDQNETVAFLTRGAEQVIRTHASVVFLRGEQAFKLKRAVRYTYLDYSSLERRRVACEAELAINRRIAPALYEAVVPVCRGADGALSLGGDGKPVDWVVVMRRFADAALLDRMAERGILTPTLMRALADTIAAFHAEAAPMRDFGGAAATRRLIDDNMVSLAKGFPADRVAALRVAQHAAIDAVAAALDRRREQGHVRRCHGDLHLGNICLHDGEPTLFDAIEFDPAISNIDVLYDLAFLLMDLRHRRLEALANLVFNAYLDSADELDGLAALPLFLSLRATIRAHVNVALDRPDPAAAYLALAETIMRPVPPRLVAVGGLSGSGKSTLAAGLAPGIGIAPGARVLRSDVTRKRLFGVPPTTRLGPEGYTEAVNDRVFGDLREQAALALAAGYSVVLDAVAVRPEQRAAFAAVAAHAAVPFTGLWLEAPAETMEQRIERRRGDASDATVAVLRLQQDRDPGAMDWIRLNSGGTPTAVLAEATKYLAR